MGPQSASLFTIFTLSKAADLETQVPFHRQRIELYNLGERLAGISRVLPLFVRMGGCIAFAVQVTLMMSAPENILRSQVHTYSREMIGLRGTISYDPSTNHCENPHARVDYSPMLYSSIRDKGGSWHQRLLW